MSLTIAQTAEAFSRHEFDMVGPFLADDVRWHGIGQPEVVGREAVLKACADSAAYLGSVITTFTAFRVLTGDGFAVVESAADFVESDGGRSVVASCDVYRFTGDRLHEITSYNVEVG